MTKTRITVFSKITGATYHVYADKDGVVLSKRFRNLGGVGSHIIYGAMKKNNDYAESNSWAEKVRSAN